MLYTQRLNLKVHLRSWRSGPRGRKYLEDPRRLPSPFRDDYLGIGCVGGNKRIPPGDRGRSFFVQSSLRRAREPTSHAPVRDAEADGKEEAPGTPRPEAAGLGRLRAARPEGPPLRLAWSVDRPPSSRSRVGSGGDPGQPAVPPAPASGAASVRSRLTACRPFLCPHLASRRGPHGQLIEGEKAPGWRVHRSKPNTARGLQVPTLRPPWGAPRGGREGQARGRRAARSRRSFVHARGRGRSSLLMLLLLQRGRTRRAKLLFKMSSKACSMTRNKNEKLLCT